MKSSSRLEDLLCNLASAMLDPVSPYRNILAGLLGTAFFGVLTLKEYTHKSNQAISDLKHNPAIITIASTSEKRDENNQTKKIFLSIMTIGNVTLLISGIFQIRYVRNQHILMMQLKDKLKNDDSENTNKSNH
jgi:glucose uptake protein GlcU